MSQHDRDLATEIRRELIAAENIERALAIWRDPDLPPEWTEHDRMKWMLAHISAAAIDTVLARRQREAARTGPWEGA